MKFKIKQIILMAIIILLCIPSITMSKYNSKFEKNGKINIAKPVIIFEEQTELNSEIINKKSFPIEYNFKIKNYTDTGVNEIEFYYNIEVQDTAINFPIKYRLFDINTNEEVILNNNKTIDMKISNGIAEEKLYKLVIEWDKRNGRLSNDTDLNIKINVVQQKKQ